MTYDVTSNFVDNLAEQTSETTRQFFIGNSDYSSRVVKWPSKISQQWDQPKPTTVGIDLANGDLGMNFLRIDKTLLTSKCLLKMGYPFVPTPNPPVFDFADYTTSETVDVSFLTDSQYPIDMSFSSDGRHVYTVSANADAVHHLLVNSEGDFTSMEDTGDVYDLLLDGFSDGSGISINGNGKKLLVNGWEHVVEYDLNPPYFVQSMTLVNSSGATGAGYGSLRASHLSADGLSYYLLDVTSLNVTQFAMTSDSVIDTLSYVAILPTSYDAAPTGIWVNSAQDLLLYSGAVSDTVYANTVYPGDISSFDVWSSNLDVSFTNTTFGLTVEDINYKHLTLVDATAIEVVVYDSPIDFPGRLEAITVFGGEMDVVSYKSGKCNLRIIDKMKKLSERLVGNDDVPVNYTSELMSDVAWWLVTSYGGFDLTASISNVDINYTRFLEWAGVVSGDNIRVSAELSGVKVTECLRKLARMSRSAIYMEDDKLVFTRFSNSVTPDVTIDSTTILDSILTVKASDIINKQYVQAGYSVASDYFTITVHDEITASVNSYGLHEEIEEDTSIWYPTSLSALTLAQRITFTDGNPVDRISVAAPLSVAHKQLGDMIIYTNPQEGVDETYRIMRKGFNLDSGKIELNIDRSQIVNPFILDVTSLDGTEVLT